MLSHLLASTITLPVETHAWIVENEMWAYGDSWQWGLGNRIPTQTFAAALNSAGLTESEALSVMAQRYSAALMHPAADVDAVLDVLESAPPEDGSLAVFIKVTFYILARHVGAGTTVDRVLSGSARLSDAWSRSIQSARQRGELRPPPRAVRGAPTTSRVPFRPDREHADHLVSYLLTVSDEVGASSTAVLDVAAVLLTNDGLHRGRRTRATFTAGTLSTTIAGILVPVAR